MRSCWSLVHRRAGRACVTAFVVFVERGQRKILVNYAKRQVGNKVYGGQSSHLPLKLNMAGVIPPIFASSIILFPATLASWFGTGDEHALAEGPRRHAVARASRSTCCCTRRRSSSSASSTRRCVFNPKETADNLKKSGAFVPGHPPGRPDRALHRQDPDAADAGRRDLHHAGVPAAGVPDRCARTCRSISAARRC